MAHTFSITLDDRLNSLLQNSNIDNLITVQPSLSKCIPATQNLLHEAVYQNSALSQFK
jgi:hypothetical protein